MIDAHHHLWDLRGGDYPWLREDGSFGPPGRYDALKGRDYRLEDYLADIDGAGVIGSVHIEAMWDPARGQENETAWLDGIERDAAIAARYVVGAAFDRPGALDALRMQAQNPRTVGVRQCIAWAEDAPWTASGPHLTATSEWRETLDVLREEELLLELMIHPDQAEEVARLAAADPDLAVVVDHKGSPMRTDEAGLDGWRRGLAVMAAQPNVSIKLSAALSYLPEQTQGHLDAQVDAMITAFGADRVIYGSDFPVAGLRGRSYTATLDAVRTSARDLAAEDQEKVFFRNAMRTYRIDPGILPIP